MKEITAIIRREKLPETKKVLDDIGYSSITIQSVEGRGKQRGSMFEEVDSELSDCLPGNIKLNPTPSSYAMEHWISKPVLYVPKRMLTVVVPDDVVTTLVKALVKVNQTGRPGDGKIFVSPVLDAIRVRTGEKHGEAIS